MADEIIARIKKLRNLAENNTFPTEAEAARAKADHLMAQHNITEAQLNPPPAWPLSTQVFTYTSSVNVNGVSPRFDKDTLQRLFDDIANGQVPQQRNPTTQMWINGVRVQ